MDDSEWEDTSDFLFRQLKTIPRELRDLIYEYAVTESTDILVTPEGDSGSQRVAVGQSVPIKPALLSVCHQIRSEAGEVYHAVNNFRAIISDDHNFMAPFEWISKLNDREAKSIRSYIVQFRLSVETKTKMDEVFHDYEVAFRAANAANIPLTDPMFQPQITVVQTKLQNMVNLDILNSVSDKMLTINDTGIFDLSRMSFETVASSEYPYPQVCKIWKGLLEECLQAARDGKILDFKGARTTVTAL